jgi:hypothetical protein
VPFLPLDPGSGMGKKSGTGIRIQDEQPRSYFWIFGLKYLKYFMRIRDGKIRIRDPGWKNSDPGSATLIYIFKLFAKFQHSLILRIINLKKASIFKMNEE